ncbi:FGGY-family carbohydrate kinase [Chelativorans sp. M5D2P16]|uniref:FGGY-family carbohydrate kinase n=1 Tax=Chelativorans sp. M5D2P16 TaxID=3095678 RepID=UPI002ACAA687|nr:FGGY-family carbohydrate kinase [Chelativorans sp. M5D2P16]MDZ5698249.1 FGGY-family carbohydrate kinase [Chelativorans sp. M5D2P16]
MTDSPLFIGLDVGTSGARAIAVDRARAIVAQGAARMADFGDDHRSPDIWWAAATRALATILAAIPAQSVRAIAVDGTSGTMLPVDGAGTPLTQPLMYNDPVADPALVQAVGDAAPATSAAHGATSGLAKTLAFQDVPGAVRVIHQADWIAGRLSGRFDVSDENNALKTGYDPVVRCWPDWLEAAGARRAMLPEVLAPGTPVGRITEEAAAEFGLPGETILVTGTTDGCASFLATGAAEIGDAVTALGSTLTVKMLCDRPIFAPEYGVYSHRFGDRWLAGGASNTGGNVLAAFFTPDELAALSERIDAASDSGLDYYPLLKKGERFPVNDPELAPRLEPRPADDAAFLQALFEGMAAVEALGYRRLAELGAPPLASLRTVGGGARNPQWAEIRARKLGVPFRESRSEEAAAGTAFLALEGAEKAGLA